MNHKKLKLLALLLFVLGLNALMAQAVLNVKEKTGTTTTINLMNVKSLTFVGGNLIVNKKDASSGTFALLGIQNLNFSPGTGIETLRTAQSSFNIFPNPVKDVLHINDLTNDIVNQQIEIIGIDGKMILSTIFNPSENGISVYHLTRGLYFCRVLNENTWKTAKFIKQ